MGYQAIIQDKQGSRWLRFQDAADVITVRSLEGVLPALERVEEQVNKNGLYAVGFISYEAAPAFDFALKVRSPGSIPLMSFGLFRKPEVINLPSQTPSYELGIWDPSVSNAEYRIAIDHIKDLIAAGRTYQVNYTFRLTSSFDGDPWGLFLDLNRTQKAHYGAYIETGSMAICSASPELFFELQGDGLVSRPMKGTAERGRTLVEDHNRSKWLYDSEKNRAENVMIVDMIRNDMGRISRVGTVQVVRLFDVERYPTLWQMTSTVRSSTDASITEILTSLFPCASITGAPKVSTMDIIAGLESTPRGVYTGCIGYMAPGRYAQFSVAIRTVVVDLRHKVSEYGVGGGIVWDSTTKSEYLECQTKALVLTERRPDFKLLESILWTPDRELFLLQEHLKRLADSAEYFGFSLDIAGVQNELESYITTLPDQAMKIRLTVERDGTTSIEGVPVGQLEPVRLALAAGPIRSDNVFLFHKTTHRQVYEDAMRSHPDFDDVLLCNEKDEITETTTANIVVEINGSLYTPPVESGLLSGTFRQVLLDQGDIAERIVTVDDLEGSDSMFVINSVRKWRKATLIRDNVAQQRSQP